VEAVRKIPRLMETSVHLVIARLVHYRTHLMKRIAFAAARPWLLKMHPITEAPELKNSGNAEVLDLHNSLNSREEILYLLTAGAPAFT
jgi:hypothetical protein